MKQQTVDRAVLYYFHGLHKSFPWSGRERVLCVYIEGEGGGGRGQREAS